MRVENYPFEGDISPYSTKQLSNFAYRKSFSENLINEFKAGKQIFVSPKGMRNETEARYLSDIFNYLHQNIAGNINEMFEAKKLRHDLWIFKIKDEFADKIAKAEYVKKNRDF